jgi:hypothetical protein
MARFELWRRFSQDACMRQPERGEKRDRERGRPESELGAGGGGRGPAQLDPAGSPMSRASSRAASGFQDPRLAGRCCALAQGPGSAQFQVRACLARPCARPFPSDGSVQLAAQGHVLQLRPAAGNSSQHAAAFTKSKPARIAPVDAASSEPRRVTRTLQNAFFLKSKRTVDAALSKVAS